MHAGNVIDNVAAGLLIAILLWYSCRLAATINQKQTKRCGRIVIGFYIFMAAYFLMDLALFSWGTYCILADSPIPWTPRAIYGMSTILIALPGLFQASSVLRHDPRPVDWAVEFSRVKAKIRRDLGLDKIDPQKV